MGPCTEKFRGKIMIYICDYASEYYINDHSKTSLDLAFTPEQFHAASAAELYDLIEHLTDRTGAWGSAEDDLYQSLACLCHVEGIDDTEELMEACKKAIAKGTPSKPFEGEATVYICNYSSEYRYDTTKGAEGAINIAKIFNPYSPAFSFPGHAADAAELYTLIDRLTDRTGWDAVEEEAYQELGRLCGYLEVNDYDGYDAFMDACKAVIEKEKANG